jgi:hypothetical protein
VLAGLLLVGGVVASRMPEPARHLAIKDLLADAGSDVAVTPDLEQSAEGPSLR